MSLLRGRYSGGERLYGGDARKESLFREVEAALTDELHNPDVNRRSPANAASLLRAAVKSHDKGVIKAAIKVLSVTQSAEEHRDTLKGVTENLAG